VFVADDVVAVAAGAAHSLFITADGELHGMGSNELGQLGEGPATNYLVPVSIAFDEVAGSGAPSYSALSTKGATLTAPAVPGGTKVTYQWHYTAEDGAEIIIPGNNKKTFTAKTTGSGIYYVTFTYTRPGGATVSETHRFGFVSLITAPKIAKVDGFTAVPAPDATVIGVANSVVRGERLLLRVVLEPGTGTGSALNYFWYRNGKELVGQMLGTTSTNETCLTLPFGDKADSYTVVVETVARDAKGVKPVASVKSKAIKPKVIIPPGVIITTKPEKRVIVEGKALTIAAKATGTAKLSYAWYKDEDGDSVLLPGQTKATLSLKKATAADAGVYRVVVTNVAGDAYAAETEAVVTVR
jgi:hypothetical protein